MDHRIAELFDTLYAKALKLYYSDSGFDFASSFNIYISKLDVDFVKDKIYGKLKGVK